MILTSTLAQQIVSNIMPIAQQNINIMNSQGIIIGSGQEDRINTFHQGAQDVIHKIQTIEIYPNDLDQYTGSIPGFNMPIILNDQVIGVVGVSGHPDKVRDIARMVKMVTELILEQEMLLEEARSHYQLRENFVTLLLSDNTSTNHNKLLKAAKLLKYDLYLPRLVLVIDIQPLLDLAFNTYGLNDLVASRTRETLVQLVSNPPHVNQHDLVVFIEDRLIILKHFQIETSEATCKVWGSNLLTLLYSNNQRPVKLGLGSLAMKYTALGNSYQEALFALKSSKTHNTVSTIHDFDILSAYLVEKINKDEPCQPIQTVKAKLNIGGLARKYDMKNTVVSLLNNNLNITSTAKSLYIHRNTLLFRLRKLKETTGLDPCRFLNHAILCKIILED